MLLTDLNAHGGIGSNCILIELDGINIVIDAGIHPKETGKRCLPRFDLLRDKVIDLIFLTHCHLDHLGALPLLARDHPNTPIIMSTETEQIYRRMLRNSCNVMERQREELGIAEYPLYAYSDITACSRQVIGISPGHPRLFETLRGQRITFTLHRAGHIPGAVGILLEHHHRKIFHSGDVLFKNTPLLDGAAFPGGDMDTIILETTRGMTRRQNGRDDELERLLRCIEETLSHGGSILIPVFALGRMQELISVLHKARAERRLKPHPIYVSGLGIDLLNQLDKISRKSSHVRVRKKMLRELGAHKLMDSHHPGRDGAAIYLLSSGMMVESTPSYMAAAALLEFHRNTIAFVGYCDPDTPGGKLVKLRQGDKYLFQPLRKTVQAQARIEKFDLSSHADREELLDFALARNPRSIVLSHGDPEAREWFHAQIRDLQPNCTVVNPAPLRPVRV